MILNYQGNPEFRIISESMSQYEDLVENNLLIHWPVTIQSLLRTPVDKYHWKQIS